MNNAIFGKTLENIRTRVNVELVQNKKRALKVIASPSFHAFKMFDNDLVAVHKTITSLKLNRPVYVGFSILDLSKELMYAFHYQHIRTEYGDRAKLLFTGNMETELNCFSQIPTLFATKLLRLMSTLT